MYFLKNHPTWRTEVLRSWEPLAKQKVKHGQTIFAPSVLGRLSGWMQRSKRYFYRFQKAPMIGDEDARVR